MMRIHVISIHVILVKLCFSILQSTSSKVCIRQQGVVSYQLSIFCCQPRISFNEAGFLPER